MSQLIEVLIDDLSRGGAGIGHLESGKVIFVPLTAPGDRIVARIVDDSERYCRGELVSMVEKSPIRIDPVCPVFGKCGGCDWQHLPYTFQWKKKIEGLGHALKRAQIQLSNVQEFPAKNQWNYRNRIQLRGTKEHLGFLKRASAEIVPIDSCAISDNRINQELSRIRQEGAKLAQPYKVEIAVTSAGNVDVAWNSKHAAFGFRQINDEANATLQNYVASQLSDGDILLDLYGGVGNLSEQMWSKFKTVHVVDFGAKHEDLKNVFFHPYDTLKWIQSFKIPSSSVVSAAIIDPPRIGLFKDFSHFQKAFDRLNVEKIVHVGCDPDAFARDLSHWLKAGWKLVDMAAVDLFPQTVHVESIAVLAR